MGGQKRIPDANIAQLLVSERFVGPPTSRLHGFWLPEIPSAQFTVYGTDGGAFSLQKQQVCTPMCDTSSFPSFFQARSTRDLFHISSIETLLS
jgi:hypothetical protein